MVALAANHAAAQTGSPSGCNANALTINIAKSPSGKIVNGTVVTYTIGIQNFTTDQSGNLGCDIQLGPSGLLFTCPAPDGTPTGTATTLLPPGTIIHAGDPVQTFTVQCTINLNLSITNQARAQVSSPGAILKDGFDDPADILKTISVNVVQPCIAVTKQCVNTCTPYGQAIQFSGVVTNCGDTPLSNVGVTDDHAGIVLGPTNVLAAGGSAGSSIAFSGSYTPSGTGVALCGPFTDTVTATGTASQVQPTPPTVTATASATCHASTSPAITLVKDCGKFVNGVLDVSTKTLNVGDQYGD